MPRRRAGVLLPLEESILEIGLQRLRDGDPEFHGFAIASVLDETAGRALTAHGTLYKVLDRLERDGLLTSRWEEIDEAAEGRPRRRLYQVADEAQGALSRSRALQAPAPGRLGIATP